MVCVFVGYGDADIIAFYVGVYRTPATDNIYACIVCGGQVAFAIKEANFIYGIQRGFVLDISKAVFVTSHKVIFIINPMREDSVLPSEYPTQPQLSISKLSLKPSA